MANRRRVRPVITLTTDFGLRDSYVAEMKGVILQVHPQAQVIDITHEIAPQQVREAVFITQAAWPAFPPGTVHVAVVDPGVGTGRRALVIDSPHGLFVGPDNGVLSAALPEAARPDPQQGVTTVPLPPGYRAFELKNRDYFRPTVSATFHGRDVFAPVAAHLTRGLAPEALGPPVDTVIALPPLRARRCSDGTLEGEVVHIDRFGNVVTDVRADDLPASRIAVEVGGEVIAGLVPTYAAANGLCALIGSNGYLEVALPDASAAAALGATVGAPVRVRAVGGQGRAG